MVHQKKPYEVIKFTEEMLLTILQGKEIHIHIKEEEGDRVFIFKGPWDGVFLTHAQISELKHNAQMSAFSIMERIQDRKKHSDPVKFETKVETE